MNTTPRVAGMARLPVCVSDGRVVVIAHLRSLDGDAFPSGP